MKQFESRQKIYRVATALYLAFCLMFAALSVPACADTVSAERYPVDHNSPYYQELASIGNGFDADAFTQFVYGKILDQETNISLPNSVSMRPRKTYTSNGQTVRTIDTIYEWLFYDCPALIHMRGIGSMESTNASGRVIAISVSYSDTAAAYDGHMQACETAARSVLKGIQGNNSLSDVEKALLIHDRLAILCEYDKENLLNAEGDLSLMPPEDFTIYGALVNHTAVCEGYAKAYKYLLAKVGIYSYICKSDEINHAWNIVYIGGLAYHVDVTHDDPIDGGWPYDQPGRVEHKHFLISDNESQRLQSEDFGIDPVSYTFPLPQVPTDTSYESAYWHDVTTEITLIDGDLYYCLPVGADAYLYRAPDTSVVDFPFTLTVFDSCEDAWNVAWPGLMTVGAYEDYFLYAQADGIYGYNVKTGAERQFLDVPIVNGIGEDDYFYMFGCSDGLLSYHVYYTIPIEQNGNLVSVSYGIMSLELTTVRLFDVNEDGDLNILDLVKAKKILAECDVSYLPGDYVETCGEIDSECLVSITRGLLTQ